MDGGEQLTAIIISVSVAATSCGGYNYTIRLQFDGTTTTRRATSLQTEKKQAVREAATIFRRPLQVDL